MRISIPIALAMLGVASGGCSDEAIDPYQQAAQEVASAAAALDQEGDGDDMALDGVEDGDAAVDEDADDDADEAAEEAAEASGDGGEHDGWDRRDGRRGDGFGRHRHGRRHGGRGHGFGLLLWYADLDALRACRDVREQCLATATDEESCRDEVRACVQPVLEQAFAAMCEEKLTMCEAADAPERHCGKIERICDADDDPTDGGTPPEPPVTSDAG
jgi:hypothetical protein